MNAVRIDLNRLTAFNLLQFARGPVTIVGNVHNMVLTGLSNHWGIRYLNTRGIRPLILAAKNVHDNVNIVRTLIEMGADVNAESDRCTALDLAAHYRKLRIIEELLLQGADIHHIDRRGETALHVSVRNYPFEGNLSTYIPGNPRYDNDLAIVQTLLRYGADVDARNTLNGITPLLLAVRAYNADIVRALLEAGADVNVRGRGGENCLHIIQDGARYKTELILQLMKAGTPLRSTWFNLRPLDIFFVLPRLSEDDLPVEISRRQLVEDVKAFLKCALLFDERSSDYLVEQQRYYTNNHNEHDIQEINDFSNRCAVEARRLRNVSLDRRRTLLHFAIWGGRNSLRILESVYEHMMRHFYDIYDDFIIRHFQRDFIRSYMDRCEIYEREPENRITIPIELFRMIYEQLSNADLFQFLRSCYLTQRRRYPLRRRRRRLIR